METKVKIKVVGASVCSHASRHPDDTHPPVLRILVAVGDAQMFIDASLQQFIAGTTRDEALAIVYMDLRTKCAEFDNNGEKAVLKAALETLTASKKWRWRGSWDCVLGAFHQ